MKSRSRKFPWRWTCDRCGRVQQKPNLLETKTLKIVAETMLLRHYAYGAPDYLMELCGRCRIALNKKLDLWLKHRRKIIAARKRKRKKHVASAPVRRRDLK